ncbi:hypothetical protein DLM78_19995 [Leptospira stimsonii]|uniref:Uncharacterized protein n=1 Tax=Leptospira stimsonii TaxID=2202203 RepID=A0A8B3CJY2_9LEPT|nr:hypothetical protein DLM78_19995 [Leptospira stimsonii]
MSSSRRGYFISSSERFSSLRCGLRSFFFKSFIAASPPKFLLGRRKKKASEFITLPKICEELQRESCGKKGFCRNSYIGLFS